MRFADAHRVFQKARIRSPADRRDPRALVPRHGRHFYAFVNIKAHLGRMYGDARVDNSTQWCLALLKQHNVATVMGSAFGAEGYARISFAASLETLEAGFERIEAFLKSSRA